MFSGLIIVLAAFCSVTLSLAIAEAIGSFAEEDDGE